MPRPSAALTESTGEKPTTAKPPIVPPPKVTARAMRPLWRDLILRVWGADPLQCPCCKGTMSRAAAVAARQTMTKEWPWSAAEG